jgi:hypothetical protein
MLEKLRELRWNYLAEHPRWMEESGFRGVDIHWAIAGHAIVSGTK